MRYKPDNVHWSRCGHSWCTRCKTRRGYNLGNRRIRHAVKAILKTGSGRSMDRTGDF